MFASNLERHELVGLLVFKNIEDFYFKFSYYICLEKYSEIYSYSASCLDKEIALQNVLR